MNKYRVLIIDDRLNNLKTAKDLILSLYQPFDRLWNIEVNTAHIIINQCDDKYSIDEDSIKNIAKLSIEPFDLLMFDIAYYIEGGSEDIYKQLSQQFDENYTFSVLEKYVFNPKTLVEEGLKQLKNNNNRNLYKWFNKNFVGHKGAIYGFTFIEEKWAKLFYNIEQCRDILIKTFKNADLNRIEMKGTRKEIFNETEFENIRKNNERYYSFILAKYLEQLIKIEIIKQEVENAKYIKIKRTSKVIGSLIFLGLIIGASSEFFGSLIVELIQKREFLIASVCIGFTMIVIVFGGKTVVHVLEKNIPKLLNYNKDPDNDS